MAFERVLADWLEDRTLVSELDLLVVDKPSGVVVHGGDEGLGADLVGRLRAWFRSRGEPEYLGVHHRLDLGASGVLLFTRSPRHNVEVARSFSEHTVERVYVAVVGGTALPDAGELVHRLAAEKGRPTRVVDRGGRLARARYRVLERRGSRALVELRPATGRTHQLRVQLAAVHAPIVGDTIYGGAAAPRLMLHSAVLGVLGRRFTAAVPPLFLASLGGRDGELGAPAEVARGLVEAAWRRAPVGRRTDAYRLVNGIGDGLPGIVVDRYCEHAVLALGSEEAIAREAELVAGVLALGASSVHVKRHLKADLRRLDPGALASPAPAAGSAPTGTVIVNENGLRLAVRLDSGLSTGLFVDQRDNRALVRRLAAGARVLNLFAYTCSFTIASATGGARETVSVDLSSAALRRGRENLALNGIAGPQHQLHRADAGAWLRRARARGERFDLVVLDPPSFGTVRGRAGFSITRDLEVVAADAIALLAPGGRLLAVTNHRKTTVEGLRRLLHRAARSAGRTVTQVKDCVSGYDCPPHPDGPSPSKSALVTVR
ncbi:MAG: class I SAM-dependent methyltransferase [Polyangiaceae bacterium]|nr:class I SAM-dependent methyltransferase [Polyangiaceae bacterium]